MTMVREFLKKQGRWLFTAVGMLGAVFAVAQPVAYRPPIPFSPPAYICYRAETPLTIDGRLDEPSWKHAPRTGDFTDIEGALKPGPSLWTEVRMLWDQQYLYIGAYLEEFDLWATLTERDAVLFQDNDFEVFIYPDGDGWYYAELEINALNTLWDLLLFSPYHLASGIPFTNNWDLRGIQTAVHLEGALNQLPDGMDSCWTVEMAIPLQALAELTTGKSLPAAGTQWRVNFSRVQWKLDVVNGAYQKTINPQTGKPFPERNWVWAPTGRIDIHRPETWGWVQFSGRMAGEGSDTFQPDPSASIQWGLWQLFYSQKEYRLRHGVYANSLDALAAPAIDGFRPEMTVYYNGFSISAPFGPHTYRITEKGRLEKF